METKEESLFTDPSFSGVSVENRVRVQNTQMFEPEARGVNIQPEARQAVQNAPGGGRVEHDPDYEVAEECLQMNKISKPVLEVQKKCNRIAKQEFQDEHPIMGPYVYKNSAETYNGQYYYGQKFGSGLEVYRNGGLYAGGFIHSEKDGFGREIMGSAEQTIQKGDDYSGPHPQQKLIDQGYQEGDYYEGDWINGERVGEGKEFREKGEIVYEGTWRNDMKNGRGKETVYEDQGTYKVLKTSTKLITDEGGVSQRKEVTEPVTMGAMYIGNWRDNKKHGKGIWKWSDGSSYEGEFKHDNISGYGKKYFST